MPYTLPADPTIIPTDDGKLIEEFFGLASTGGDGFSLAHMVAPPGWSEPYQRPEFDEVTLLLKGRKQFEVDGETIVLEAGQVILVAAGSRVRYSNPFDEPAEYWSICMPAFSPERVKRENG